MGVVLVFYRDGNWSEPSWGFCSRSLYNPDSTYPPVVGGLLVLRRNPEPNNNAKRAPLGFLEILNPKP